MSPDLAEDKEKEKDGDTGDVLYLLLIQVQDIDLNSFRQIYLLHVILLTKLNYDYDQCCFLRGY